MNCKYFPQSTLHWKSLNWSVSYVLYRYDNFIVFDTSKCYEDKIPLHFDVLTEMVHNNCMRARDVSNNKKWTVFHCILFVILIIWHQETNTLLQWNVHKSLGKFQATNEMHRHFTSIWFALSPPSTHCLFLKSMKYTSPTKMKWSENAAHIVRLRSTVE